MTRDSGNERRKAVSFTLEQPPGASIGKLGKLLSGFQLTDILSTKYHSDDFMDTRAFFILGRLKIMAYIFAILVPLSFVFDIILLEHAEVQNMFYARMALSVSLIVLALFCRKKHVGMTLNFLLPLGFILPALFYVDTQLVLIQTSGAEAISGYSLMPFLFVSMLALFPLTIVYSLTIILMIFTPFILIESFLANATPLGLINKVWAFSTFAGVTLWLQSSQLVMLLKLYRESTIDPLTGLINRRVLMKRLEKEIDRGHCFFILMFDLDKFKRINDTYGHLDGDLVLKITAQIISKEIRDKDIVARFGGEEFVAVLSELTVNEAIAIAERIRCACEQAVIINKDGNNINVTTSIGVTQHVLTDELNVTFNRADQLLYKAKSEGRNKVVSG
jgi:diguanylate cyclase (GGDEF)-like protein